MRAYLQDTYITALLIAAGFVLLFIIWIVFENRKNRERLLKRFRGEYGRPSGREYRPGDMERISRYFRRKENEKENGFVIDDITWNDLDMDRLYQMVNVTVSSPGEDVLYAMLRSPLFSETELGERDSLIRFFSENREKRERLQLCLCKAGKAGAASLSDMIAVFDDAPLIAAAPHAAMLVLLLAAAAVILPLFPVPGFFLLMLLSVANVVIYYGGKDRRTVEPYMECFIHLLGMLAAADEMESVTWPEVKKQMTAIRRGKQAFSRIRRRAVFLTGKSTGSGDYLQLLMDYLRMILHVDLLMYNSLVKEVRGRSGEIMLLLENLGELDAAIAIASFRASLKVWCRPEFVPWDGKGLSLLAEELYHPLVRNAVPNSLRAEGGTLVTGSNASGKSTFLKNIAINSILAQTFVTCTCTHYRAPCLKVMTSMALRDDLAGGESYFIVEIRSLKRILEVAQKKEPLLCIIDEVLRGTNTIERIAASSRILLELDRDWILPFAATHDIELTAILDRFYTNYHFQEEIRDHQVIFHYRLQKGRASTRNAIRLLDMMGYDKALVESAERAAEDFDHTGTWKRL